MVISYLASNPDTSMGTGRSLSDTISAVRRKHGFIQQIILLLLSLPMMALADSDPHLTATQLKQLRGRIDTIQIQIDQLRGQRQQSERVLRETERRISVLGSSIRQLGRRIVRQRKDLQRIQQQIAEQSGRLNGNQDALKQQVRAAYISGQEAYLKLILSQRDPQRMGRMLVYYDYLNHARVEEIDGLQTTLQKLADLNRRKQETQNELQASLQKKERDKRTMEVSQQQRQTLLSQLALRLEDKEVELAQLKEDEQRLHTLLNDLNQALSDIPAIPKQLQAFERLKGQLNWPVSGKLEARYGTQRSRGLRWKGVLLDASKDNQVRVVSHGRIAFSDWLRGYGLLTIVDHGNGYMSLYGQNHSLYKKAGDWVERGEIIAEAGDKGGEQPRLYFEIRHRGKPVNPQRWCRR